MRKYPLFRGIAALALAGGVAFILPTPATSAPVLTAVAAPAPDISLANQKAHVQQFQTIATNNGGNRRSTSPGYTASVNYVYDKLVAAGYSVVKQTCASGCTSGAGPNIIADWPGGPSDQVIMFGAHLDSVSAGPGANDNGSGSATILEVALTLAAQNPTMTKHVRFGWWTDEEQGLNGSDYYVTALGSTERAKIKAYYNFDMVSSVNGGYFINRITSAQGQIMKAYFDSIGVQTEENTEGAGRSDDASFNSGGVPTSGFATGASYVKTAAQVTKWGGTQSSYDPCYHRACDTYPSNVEDTRLNRAGDVTAYVLWNQAVGAPVGDDFSIGASPTSGSVNPGSSATTTVSATLTAGAAQTVNLSASGLPSGATASFSPTSISSNGGSSTLTIATSASTPAGSYTVTVTGTGTAVTHTATYTLTVNGAPGCSGTNPNDVTITDNATVESSIVISGCAGNAGAGSTVEVHIVHTYIGDMLVDLVAPDGTAYTLHNRAGGSADNINQTYTVNLGTEVANGTWKLRVNDNANNDVGKIDTWTLNLTGGGVPSCGGNNGTDVTIPDNTTVESSIVISGCTGNASSTSSAEVHIVHTYRGDLVVTLVAPDGSTYVLLNRSGGSADNVDQTFTVNLSGEARNGTWKLRVQDAATTDTGRIDTWTLTL